MKSQNEMKKEIVKFMKEAFCVDGEVKILKAKEVKDFIITGVIELNDTKRKTFYIGLLGKSIK